MKLVGLFALFTGFLGMIVTFNEGPDGSVQSGNAGWMVFCIIIGFILLFQGKRDGEPPVRDSVMRTDKDGNEEVSPWRAGILVAMLMCLLIIVGLMVAAYVLDPAPVNEAFQENLNQWR